MGINQLNITQDSSGVQRVISISNSGSGEALYIQQFAPNANVTALKVDMPSLVNDQPVVSINSSASDTSACACRIVHKTNTVGLQIITDGTGALDAPLVVVSNNIQITNSKTPASASAAGNPGQICWDSSFVYVCVAPNSWKRSPLSTWV